MANEDYKNGKLIEIVREFNHEKGTTKYEINGITQSIAVPFWRIAEGKFNVIPKGSYKFMSEAGNDYIEILDQTILETAHQFQIDYIYSQISSKYEEDFPEINVFVGKYNELVDDTKKLFSYLKSVGMIADTLQMSKVLSPLEPLTTWYMDENGEIKTLPISELYNKFQIMIDTLHEKIKVLLEKDYKDISNKLSNQTKDLLNELVVKTNNLKTQLQNFADKLEKDKKALLDDYVNNTLKPNLDEYNTAKKKELDEVKTKAINDIMIQENSTLQNILNAESKSVKAVEDKGIEERKTLEDMGVDIKTQLELLLQNADIANLQTLIGNCYKGVYSAFNKYFSGDIYYKKDTEVVEFDIPASSSPVLTKKNSTQNIKKFFRLYGDVEGEYNFTDNGDNRITGFELEGTNNLIRTNSTVELEFNTINYTVAVSFPNTEVTDLIKALTTEQDNSATTLIKKQTDLPLYTLDTQRSPELRKIQY